MPQPPPALSIPPGTGTTVTVSAIDSTLSLIGCPSEYMWSPAIKGFPRVTCGCWSILIQHPSSRNLLYDLGTRKDWENLPPACGLKKYMADGILKEVKVERDVGDMMREAGIVVEGVIWSHFHWDHTGDMSKFPKETKLIVGEGFKGAFMPGFPVNPKAHTLESDFEGREVEELDFGSDGLKIGNFKAIDYFGDGSFYLLDTPGHALGHVNALARTGDDEFIHLCGDSAHHCGEIRPSRYVPLPDEIEPSPLQSELGVCPGGLFHKILKNGSKEDHLIEFVDLGAGTYEDQKYALIYDEPALRETVKKVEGFDANETVLTVLAHDWTLKGVIDEWPKSLNGWRRNGWRKEAFWKFLGDFEEAAMEGEGEIKS